MAKERERSQGTVRWALAPGQSLTKRHGVTCQAGKERKFFPLLPGEGWVKGQVPCGFSGQSPEPPEGSKADGDKEPRFE